MRGEDGSELLNQRTNPNTLHTIPNKKATIGYFSLRSRTPRKNIVELGPGRRLALEVFDALTVLHRVLAGVGGAQPRVVITDKLASYPPAIKRVLPTTATGRLVREAE